MHGLFYLHQILATLHAYVTAENQSSELTVWPARVREDYGVCTTLVEQQPSRVLLIGLSHSEKAQAAWLSISCAPLLRVGTCQHPAAWCYCSQSSLPAVCLTWTVLCVTVHHDLAPAPFPVKEANTSCRGQLHASSLLTGTRAASHLACQQVPHTSSTKQAQPTVSSCPISQLQLSHACCDGAT